MEKKNLNLVPSENMLIVEPPNTPKGDNMSHGTQATMDVTGSLRKISRELSEMDPKDPDLPAKLEAASWLVHYIADCLDVELSHAAARGRLAALGLNGNVQAKEQHELNPGGQRIYPTISGDEI